MQKTIDYYHFLISPWSYLGIGRFNEIVDRHGAIVNYKPIAVMPTFEATGGLPPAKRHPSRQRMRMDELKRWSEFLQLPLNLSPAHFPVDCSMASRMVIAAGQEGRNSGELSDAILTAVWAEEKNIGDEETMVSIANDCEMDGAALLSVAQSDALATEFDSITREALDRDVFGSPTYVINGENFWGQDRLEFLDRYLASLEES